MKTTGINPLIFTLFVLFVIPCAASLDFTLNSPESAGLNESFSVSISAQTPDTYDVKIIVVNNATGTIISEIYNEGWKNPYYYLKSVFPEKSGFEIRVKNYSTDAAVCARLRKSGSSSFTERCNPIAITGSETENNDEEDEEENKEDADSSEPKTSAPGPDFVPLSGNSISGQNALLGATIGDAEPIRLVKNSPSEKTFVTKEEKIRLFAVYSFTALTIFIIIFLSFRRL